MGTSRSEQFNGRVNGEMSSSGVINTDGLHEMLNAVGISGQIEWHWHCYCGDLSN